MHGDDADHLRPLQLDLGSGAVSAAQQERHDGGGPRRVGSDLAGDGLPGDPPVQHPGQQVLPQPQAGAGGVAMLHEIQRDNPSRPEQGPVGVLGQRLAAFLHPHRAQRLGAGVDADRDPALDAQLRPLVDVHDVLARAKPLVDAPFAEHLQVRFRPLPAQDGQPAQLVDFVGGPRVRQHAVGGVLDADAAAGQRRDGLGQREQVAEHLAGIGVGGASGSADHVAGQRFQLFPAHLGADIQQGDAGVGGGLPQRFGVLDGDGGGTAFAGGAHVAGGRPAAGADHQHEVAGAGVGGVVGVEDDHVAHLGVEAVGRGQHLDERLAECEQQLLDAGSADSRALRSNRLSVTTIPHRQA